MSLILPASAILYASGSTDNSDDSSTGGSSTDNSSSSTGGSSTDNSSSSTGGGTITTTDNSATLPTTSTASNNAGNAQGGDLANSILAVHNQERAAVGVPPLVWSDELAAGAQTWAEHLATTGEFAHNPNRPNGVGESIAGFNPSKRISAPGEGQSLW
jgi:uncharacterized protein YkwD